MNKRTIAFIGIGVLAFAITLGIVTGIRLAGQSMAVVLGVAIGVVIGMITGVASALIALRSGYAVSRYPVNWGEIESDEAPTMIALTTEQADALLQALQRQQAAPDVFPLPAHRREFSAVGGASLTDDEK